MSDVIKIEQLKGLGAKRTEMLKKLGIDDVDALLGFYPRNYEDWSKCFSISSAPLGEQCCVKAWVATKVSAFRVRKGLTLFKFTVTDGETRMFITIFNNKYAAEKLYPGGEFLFFGKVTGNFNRKEMTSPQIEPATSSQIRPIYHATTGINSKFIEKMVKQALNLKKDDIFDPLSNEIREQYNLCHKRYAIKNIHFPENDEAISISRKRLVFEELLILQLGLLMLKSRNRENTSARLKCNYTNEFLKLLPFEPTGAQMHAISEAIEDMQKSVPMNRLLQGDVGSGKTAVAAALMFNTAKNGFQSAMMAPTEILAEQHYISLSKMLSGSKIRIMLLKGSTPSAERKKILTFLQSGEIDILVGTHAIIQNGVEYKNLGLVITDEQHRFGVGQRSALSAKGKNPHVFVMSATPIPRTLALVVYGDLDISILDELPKGRKPTETYAVSSKLRQRAYGYIKKHLDEGFQGYIICPMVDEGENELDLAAAVKFYDTLKNGFFKDYSIGLLNGKMKSSEKEAVMRDFSSGKTKLLVATTVIEVGVDVPNATIMVIENAERFGLSQLHQLRGRVGRGSDTATCILISDAENDDAKKRLEVMCKTTDGFKIADEDLRLRGPGDFFGSRQHGLPNLKIANIFEDRTVLKSTKKLAEMIIKDDNKLKKAENNLLLQEVNRLFGQKTNNSFN